MKTPFALIHTVVAVSILAAPLLSASATSLLNFSPAKQWPAFTFFTGKPGTTLALAGDHVYVGSDDGDIQISKVSNPTNQVALGTLTLTNTQRPSEVVVSGPHLYVRYYSPTSNDALWPSGGFHVFNVSDPANPVRIGGYDPGHALSAFEVSLSNAYVAFYDTNAVPPQTGVRVLDVSNPAQPVPLSVYTNADGANGMAILSNRLYLANGKGLEIVDVSNPQQPILLGSFHTFEGAYDVAVAGNYAYVVTGRESEFSADAGLEVIDVSNSSQPQRAGIFRTQTSAARVTVHEHFAYVIANIDPGWRRKTIPAGGMVQVFDVSDPANPTKIDKSNLSAGFNSYISGVAVANGHLFLPGILIHDTDGPFISIYRIDEVPAVGPTLSMKSLFSSPELWTQSPGFDDFTLMTSTSLTNWQPYATVFSRVENFQVLRDWTEPQNKPSLFYRAAGEVLSPAAMLLQWKAAGIPRYRFRFERSCFCSPRGLSGMVTVDNGMITRVDGAQDDRGNPITNPDLFNEFKSIEGLFGLLQSSLGTVELMMIKRNAERHFPTWIYVDRNVQWGDDSVIYQITDLVPIE